MKYMQNVSNATTCFGTGIHYLFILIRIQLFTLTGIRIQVWDTFCKSKQNVTDTGTGTFSSFDQGCGSGFNDFVDPDPWARKMNKKIALILNFLNIFIAKR
jgi:hypothetical protein